MELRATVDNLINEIVGSNEEAYIDETEEWVDGMYLRTAIIPRGVLAVGHIHKKECINILSKGKLLIKAEMEEDWILVEAPWTGISKPGSQKIGYALEDCTFINIIRTDKTTSKETYEDIVVPDIRSIVYHKYNLEGSY
jgi:hypothetical protein